MVKEVRLNVLTVFFICSVVVLGRPKLHDAGRPGNLNRTR